MGKGISGRRMVAARSDTKLGRDLQRSLLSWARTALMTMASSFVPAAYIFSTPPPSPTPPRRKCSAALCHTYCAVSPRPLDGAATDCARSFAHRLHCDGVSALHKVVCIVCPRWVSSDGAGGVASISSVPIQSIFAGEHGALPRSSLPLWTTLLVRPRTARGWRAGGSRAQPAKGRRAGGSRGQPTEGMGGRWVLPRSSLAAAAATVGDGFCSAVEAP